MDVKLIISDFDGTLVDTFEANYRAYRDAFAAEGIVLTAEKYRSCFGLRFDNFMREMGIADREICERIRHRKGENYPKHFECLRVNEPLLGFVRAFRRSGGKTAIASTARRVNLLNALDYIGATDDFDIVLAGENVACGKPDPEIYNRVLELAGVDSSEALIFEDSAVGFEAAKAAGINYIGVNQLFF